VGDDRPIPRLAPDTAFFWQAGADDVLRVLGCGDCDRLVHPPVPRCRHCGSSSLAPRDLSGRATLWSWTEVHQPFITWLEVPYVVGIVALDEDEDVHLTTRVIDADAAELAIGMPMAVRFEPVEHAWLPLFTPVRHA
jgi:uncharacterized protein